jgi:hypothetical protein
MGEVEPYILAQSANHNQEGKKATDNKTEFHYIKSVNEECPLVLVHPVGGQDRMRCDGIQFRYFAGGVVLQGAKGCEGSFSVPGGQK